LGVLPTYGEHLSVDPKLRAGEATRGIVIGRIADQGPIRRRPRPWPGATTCNLFAFGGTIPTMQGLGSFVLIAALFALPACGSETDGPAPEGPPPVSSVTPRTPTTPTTPTEAPKPDDSIPEGATDPSPSTPVGAPSEAERRCSADAECALAPDECGYDVGVHRDRKAAYEERMAARRARPRCEPRIGAEGPWDELAAFCADGLCDAIGAGRRCASHGDCEIVAGPCSQVAAVNHSTADEVRREFGRRVRTRTCSGLAHAPPLVARCEDHACVRVDVGMAELRRGCRDASQCTAILGVCNAWKVVSRTQLRQAEQTFAAEAAGVDCNDQETADPPEVACVNDYCVPAP